MKNLLEFLGKYYHWVLFVVLEVISLVMLFQFNSYQGSVWFSSANSVVGCFYEWTSSVESFFSLTKVNKDLALRNFYLERQVTQLRRLYGEATEKVDPKEQQGLDFLSQYKLIPAKVVSNELNRVNNLMTINKGSADSVKVGMGVACGQGVVGVTYLVAPHYTVVTGMVKMQAMLMWKIFPVMPVSSEATGWKPMDTQASSLQEYWSGRLLRSITRVMVFPIS